jgi:hypothetical protein
MDVKELDIFGADVASHWYYVAKGRALRSLVAGAPADAVLDVGAGSGVFSRQLLDAGLCRRAVCVDPAYPADSRELHNGREIRFVRAPPAGRHELVLLMDVLEHVADDVALLRQYTGALASGDRVIISVPAFQWLWSGHDEFLGHHRRYTHRDLARMVAAAGLRILHMRYYFALILPLAAARRRLERLRSRSDRAQPSSDLRRAPPLLNGMLITLHDLERMTLFRVNRLGGLTIFCVATRA